MSHIFLFSLTGNCFFPYVVQCIMPRALMSLFNHFRFILWVEWKSKQLRFTVGYIQQTTSEFPSLVPQPAAFIPWRIFSYLPKRLWDSSRSMSSSREIHWRGPAVWSAMPHGWGFRKAKGTENVRETCSNLGTFSVLSSAGSPNSVLIHLTFSSLLLWFIFKAFYQWVVTKVILLVTY